MIKQFWTSLSSIGIKPNGEEKHVKRITLINQYTFIAFLLYLINGVSDLLLGFTYEGIVLGISSLVIILCLYLNKLHHHRISVTILYIFIGLTIYYFGSLAGVQSGDYLYYFPLILSISFAFDARRDRLLIVILFLFTLALILLNAFSYTETPSYNSNRYSMFVVNLMLSIATVGFFIYLTGKNNEMINDLYKQRLKEREESEITVKKALKEKEVLLAELHHRVKNNLAIMVGFFNMRLNTTHNEEARAVLLESKNRVNSMALIHNHLYRKEDFSEINFSTYINDLVEEIKNSYPSLAKMVTVQSDIAAVKLNLNMAIPCALILNELLTNCYKHAFKERDRGHIVIGFTPGKDEQELKLSVSDNGIGLKDDFNSRDSMGITVIQALSQQLNGKHSYRTENGTHFELVFGF